MRDGVTAFWLTPFDAWMMNVSVVAVVGVPDRTPVDGLRTSPAGSVPDATAKEGEGVPVAVNVYV